MNVGPRFDINLLWSDHENNIKFTLRTESPSILEKSKATLLAGYIN